MVPRHAHWAVMLGWLAIWPAPGDTPTLTFTVAGRAAPHFLGVGEAVSLTVAVRPAMTGTIAWQTASTRLSVTADAGMTTTVAAGRSPSATTEWKLLRGSTKVVPEVLTATFTGLDGQRLEATHAITVYALSWEPKADTVSVPTGEAAADLASTPRFLMIRPFDRVDFTVKPACLREQLRFQVTNPAKAALGKLGGRGSTATLTLIPCTNRRARTWLEIGFGDEVVRRVRFDVYDQLFELSVLSIDGKSMREDLDAGRD
jgi:hypothetical protein